MQCGSDSNILEAAVMSVTNGASGPDLSNALESLTRKPTLDSLNALVGPEQAENLWQDACRQAGVSPDESSLQLDQMDQIAQVLIAQGGAIALVGSSLSIRVRTYRMLHSAERLGSFIGGQAQ